MKVIGSVVGAIVAGFVIMLVSIKGVYPAISELSGLAVAQSATKWNNVRDASVGDNLTDGIFASGLMLFDGTNFDRARGTVANGLAVDVTRIQGNIGVQPIEGITTFNAQSVSAANTAISITISGAASTRIHLYKISRATCSPTGIASLLITDGATAIWSSNIGVPSFPYALNEEWPVGLTGTTNTNMLIQVGACGAGNVSVVEYQADRF